MNRTLLPAVMLIFAFGSGAQAQTMKPGLWEITHKMQSASGDMEKGLADMQKQMAAMPPEQRKMMQDMLAKQGIATGAGGMGSTAVKVCMTREMIERNEVAPPEGDCKASPSPRTGNTMKMSFTCTKPPTTGEGQVTFVSAEAYTSKMVVKTQAGGRPEQITMDGQGKWLSAECGAIKPMVLPKK